MASTLLRHPAVAGRFYPGDPDDLRAEAQSYLSESQDTPIRAIGCIAPHAGYVYSGHVAGAVFAHVEIPERCIVLCPNHTGMGVPLAILSEGAWETPLGDVPIDSDLARSLKNEFPALEEDLAAHRAEHAAEVELPFLQLRQTAFEVCAHCRGNWTVRDPREDGRGHGSRNRRAEIACAHRSLERHESLRI